MIITRSKPPETASVTADDMAAMSSATMSCRVLAPPPASIRLASTKELVSSTCPGLTSASDAARQSTSSEPVGMISARGFFSTGTENTPPVRSAPTQ
jgi:hypothetical protein